jgi:error-prone DNA polymerase
LRKDELKTLAGIGALNFISCHPERQLSCHPERSEGSMHFANQMHRSFGAEAPQDDKQRREPALHRRDALWQVARAVRASGPLIDELAEPDSKSPLLPMNAEERLVADFHGTGLTVGPHPMAYHRAHMDRLHVRKACDLAVIPNGRQVRVAGCVIARQRPGTAHGFVFLSLEDETGVANAIVTPGLFQQNRLLLTAEQFLMVEGKLQNQDGVISVKASQVQPLNITHAETDSHDFY